MLECIRLALFLEGFQSISEEAALNLILWSLFRV
jgi:hypothetical protein